MQERYARHPYFNRHISKYEQIFTRSCPSAGLYLAYKSMGLIYPETQIRQDLNKGPRDLVTWYEMYIHATCLGFDVDFIHGLGYETLMMPLHSERYVMIVGWHPEGNPANMHHISPVRAVCKRNITLSETSEGAFYTINKQSFIDLWYDSEGNKHPFMTIRKHALPVNS